jgi:REP element-mobilizing transposase RayT
MSRPKRLPHVSYIGKARYFLTFCVHDRREAFRDADAAVSAITQFLRTATEERFAVLAYCLMPDHAHLLVEGIDDEADLLRFAKLAKQRSGALYRRTHEQRLWQEGYFERVLRDDDNGRALARYIIDNPVRKQLVASPHEYPHLGSSTWTIDELLESVM